MFLRTRPTPLSFPGWPTCPRLSSLSHSRCRSGPTRQRPRRLPCADRAAPPALSPAGRDQPPFSLLLMPPHIALTHPASASKGAGCRARTLSSPLILVRSWPREQHTPFLSPASGHAGDRAAASPHRIQTAVVAIPPPHGESSPARCLLRFKAPPHPSLPLLSCRATPSSPPTLEASPPPLNAAT
jgi:hypothetical protein